MTENEIIGAATSLAGVVLTVIGMAFKLSRAITSADLEIRADMDAQIDNLQRDIAKNAEDSVQRTEVLRRETGEMGLALRTKIHEFETWSRDTFVRRESFEMVVSRLEKSIEKMTDRLEEKFDKAVERLQSRPE